MNALKPINLPSPFSYIALFIRLDPDGWRFHSWKAAVGHTLPEDPPPVTLGRVFPTPEAYADFFIKALRHPEEVALPEPSRAVGCMPPAPVCSYYWPPPLDLCIEHYENNLFENKVPIERVFILGAGFSRAFQFATSNTIVSGVMSYFYSSLHGEWYQHQYSLVKSWLDAKFPNWQADSPPLYEFLDSFFSPLGRCHLRRFIKASNPLRLHDQAISWETNNCNVWIKTISNIPIQETYDYLISFEALLAFYLFSGRTLSDVNEQWALELFGNFMPTDAILTFNWDVIPEALMMESNTPFCRYDWTSERVKLIKLHGSVDLIGSPNRDMRHDLAAKPDRFECITDDLWRVRTADDVLVRTAPLGRFIYPWERYNKSAVLIMPPRYSLGYGYKLIQFNWRKARTALERAKQIYIIGYSIPKEDLAFWSLARKASRGWDSQVTVDVWNPDPLVNERARRLFKCKNVTFHEAYASSFHFR